jgi:hypothetical protein
MSEFLTQRDALLMQYWNLHALWRAGGDPARGMTVDDAKRQRDEARIGYFDQLPVVAFSRCPYCDTVLAAQFDPGGLDGFWWQERELGAARDPEACPHFRLLTGALSLQGNAPLGGEYPAYPGPDVPYVIPEILQQDTAMAVIASLAMQNGYRAYSIAYFSSSEVAADALSPMWRRTTCSFTTPDGHSAWSARCAPWDFELAPWISRGKLRWALPDDPELKLCDSGHCPYLDLPGKRKNQIVKQDRLRFVDPPSGDEPDPFSS